jgi:hypothetical protein
VTGREAHAVLRLSALDVSRFTWATGPAPGRDESLGAYATARLRLFAGDTPCRLQSGPRALAAPPGQIAVEWWLGCPETGGLTLRSDLLLDVAPAHLHFARVADETGAIGERVLSERERTWTLEPISGRASSFTPAFRLGIAHMASGYDHLAFLGVLLLSGGSLVDVAKIVAGFTVAHSLALTLATLGLVGVARGPVEALVGLSVALVAAENVWLAGRRGRTVPALLAGGLALLALAAVAGHGRVPVLTLAGLAVAAVCYFPLRERLRGGPSCRWGIAFALGLVHGLALASVLGSTELVPGRVAVPMLGFNLGVEAGQLAILALAWPLLATRAMSPRVVEAGSAAMAALGVFWFVTRAYG